jgi:hypothetical protein
MRNVYMHNMYVVIYLCLVAGFSDFQLLKFKS